MPRVAGNLSEFFLFTIQAVAVTGVISLYLRGISPTHFASFPHPFASFPQQICFISPTNCFVSPTKCCISPTNCCISPTIFSFPQHNFVSLCQKIKSSKFRHLLIKIRIPDICDSGHGDDGLKSVPNDPPLQGGDTAPTIYL